MRTPDHTRPAAESAPQAPRPEPACSAPPVPQPGAEYPAAAASDAAASTGCTELPGRERAASPVPGPQQGAKDDVPGKRDADALRNRDDDAPQDRDAQQVRNDDAPQDRDAQQVQNDDVPQEQQNRDDDAQDVLDEEEQDALYEHFSVTADRGQSPLRLDKFLAVRIEHCSRNRIQAAVDAGNVRVNGLPAKSSYKVKPLDRIAVVMPYPKRETELVPEHIPLAIPYEDDELLIVDKAAGMVVHPGHGNYSGTLVHALAYHLQQLALFREGDMRAGLVHRIDKDTSGLLVVAKTERAHAFLARQFFEHTIQRRYVALVWGNLPDTEGTVTGHIGRSPRDRQRMQVFPDGEQGKHAVTHYRVLRRYGYVTLVECRLETGRTHQIRVHMAWIGHPLFNDARYGGDRILKGTTFAKYRQFVENCFTLLPRQALHARSLGFLHPQTRQQVLFESPLPADMQAVLDKWDAYTASGLPETSDEP